MNDEPLQLRVFGFGLLLRVRKTICDYFRFADNPPGIVGSDPRSLLRTKWVDRSARVLRNGAANGSLIANL
ncbi:hypothetical protein SBA1_580005 [Candidatus Sulfotelmatobacter kueseliae]|uniref:Uncharacterized protein n=1 Tax=Candidatus Sulfotelmatobacter kueseliae TaxID=2042962 RepID=A0A2U3L0A8_9BACT|nr:hypothetical protein SBA1_580005 [Candidatus Sulfotelmatobacter kueseliae]